MRRRESSRRYESPDMVMRLRAPVTWWKYAVIRSLPPEQLERLIKALREGTAHVLPVEEVDAALAGDAQAALRVAIRLLKENRRLGWDTDLMVAWGFLSFVRGESLGALLIAEAHRTLVERIEHPPFRDAPSPDARGLAALRKRMYSWYDHAELATVMTKLPEAAARLAVPPTEPVAPDLPSLQPVVSIPEGGKWGRDVARAYAGLTQPIALRGGAIDPDRFELTLIGEMPWFREAIAGIADDIRLRKLGANPFVRFRPTLLLGPPGVGKTRFALRLARALGLPLRIVAGAAATHAHDIAGLSRIYESTQPSIVARVMLDSQTANPVVLVDEIDKAPSGGRAGRLVDALLPFLEGESARQVPDESLLAPVDMSAVNWLMTANYAAFLTGPLLDRLRIVEVQPPGIEYLPGIIKSLLSDIAAEVGTDTDQLPELPSEVRRALERTFKAGRSIRTIKRMILAAISAELRGAPQH